MKINRSKVVFVLTVVFILSVLSLPVSGASVFSLQSGAQTAVIDDINVETTEPGTWICPTCGAWLSSKFCPNCGAASPEPTSTPEPAPSPVPMDLSKPVKSVARYGYDVILEDTVYSGLFSGEIVDGFPHGYGAFECEEWAYIGDWQYGRPEDGRYYTLAPGEGFIGNISFTSHADYIAAENETEVEIESFVQAHQSWWDNKVTVYLQSPDGAYFAYELACSEEDARKLVPGTKIRVKGYKGEWAGEVEIMDGSFEFLEGETWIAEATDVTEILASDELITHMNEFVSVKGATVVAQEDGSAFAYKNPEGKTDDLYFAVKVDGQIYDFCVEYYLTGPETEVYKAVESLQVGDVIDLEGFLYWYNGANLQATSVEVRE